MDCRCVCLGYLSLHHKIQKMVPQIREMALYKFVCMHLSIKEEVDKGCSRFCVTVSTVTRTAGILIHSWLKVLAVKFEPAIWPTLVVCWLNWL